MKLEGFRELLLKKSADADLDNMIRFVRDDILADIIVESLEKMARAKSKGDHANMALRDFGLEMDPELHPAMIHDALGHHASRYKAALRDNRKDLANSHAKQIFNIMDMADQAQKHSHGKLDIKAVPIHPWERNAKPDTFKARMDSIKSRMDAGEEVSPREIKWLSDNPVTRGKKKPGQYVSDTDGWRYRSKDYGFLQGAPHHSYSSEVEGHGHLGAYPMEEIRVNGKYVHIDDISSDDLKGYEQHPLDHHPIMDHYSKPASKRTPEHDQQYLDQKEKFYDSRHMESYWDKHEKLESSDPEAYSQRGSQASDPVHAEVEPLDLSKPKEVEPASAAVSKPDVKRRAAPANSAAEEAKAIVERLKNKGTGGE